MRSGQRSKAWKTSICFPREKSLTRTSCRCGKICTSLNRRAVRTPGRRLRVPSARSGTAINNSVDQKEFLKRFVDAKALGKKLQVWLQEKLRVQQEGLSHFEPPFHLHELRQFDFALEGIMFHQSIRMPSLDSLSKTSLKTEMCLAAEDFLYAVVQALWKTFWSSDDMLPFFVTNSNNFNPESSSGEQNCGIGRVDGPFCAALIGKPGEKSYPLWEHVGEFMLLKSSLGNYARSDGLVLSPRVMSQAVFYGLRMLLSRKSASRVSTIHNDQDTAYIVLADSQYAGVIRLKGDVNELNLHTSNVYESAAQWIQDRAQVALSAIEKVWSKFGTANWRDLGALHILLATFHSMEQCQGPPKKSIGEMATEHNILLQPQAIASQLSEAGENDCYTVPQYQIQSHGKVVEIEEDSEPLFVKDLEHLTLEPGMTLWLEGSDWKRGFKIHEDLSKGKCFVYSGTSLDEANKFLNVYVGVYSPQVELSWEDLSTWYQVDRQTHVLNIMKQKGVSSRYLPQLVASGKLLHPGSCSKQSPNGQCDHPWCGIPALVTSPAGESLDMVVKKEGVFSSDEALKCCYDCLSALQTARSVGIQHGHINPEHIIRVIGVDGYDSYVLTEWGHAVLEDTDCVGMSLRFSSTYALQQGRLDTASDAESLVYLLYFLCGGIIPQFDDIESALIWRERSWTRRTIQQQLGEVSPVLKAFADYTDSLCGTSYHVDYDIWLRKLNREEHHREDPGRRIAYNGASASLDEIVESSAALGM